MHLLLAQKGTLADGGEAIDLGQTPGDIVFMSAADTELAAIAAANRIRAGERKASLRVASLMALRHPMSVDTHIERTDRHARLIIVRALGGASYFAYLLDALLAAARTHAIRFVALPGDDKPDPGLDGYRTISQDDARALWAYLGEGGIDNARTFLDYAEAIIFERERPGPAVPLLKADVYHGPSSVAEASRPADLADGAASAPAHRGEGSGVGGTVAICFYRALVQAGQTAPVDALIAALQARGMTVVPVYVSSLKDPVCIATLEELFKATPPDVVINLTGFAVSAPGGEAARTVLERNGAVVLQAVLASTSRDAWLTSCQGLSARDLAMNVALPEVDGRVLSRAISFKSAAHHDAAVQANIVAHEPDDKRVAFVAQLAANWVRLRRKTVQERRVALVLANYPNRDGRLGNGVGLDTPASTVNVLRELARAGYPLADIPDNAQALMARLLAGPTNAASKGRVAGETMSRADYQSFWDTLPQQIRSAVSERWGAPEDDPFFDEGRFHLPLVRLGETLVGIQPARGYNIDPKETYHAPDLVPPHGYLAFYAYLRNVHGADVIVHMGKHGNLEWLPGKALALSQTCYPEAVLGPLPHVYPFIVNDPGEGTQAKRRSSAVIIDHLTPPLTRAESYGPLKDLEALVDEYYEAAGTDPRRLKLLKRQIFDLVVDLGLDHDIGMDAGDGEASALEKLDAWLCELKEMQIRDGLHIFGQAPEGRLLSDLVVALARLPRGALPEQAGLTRAIAADAFEDAPSSISSDKTEGPFDPLDCAMAAVWTGPRPARLAGLSAQPWRTQGDTVERLEMLATELVTGEIDCPQDWHRTQAVMREIDRHIRPSVTMSGPAEVAGLLRALDGHFVAPGPSGAPTRGRADVLPTGRNFYSVDSRAVPTPAAWELGRNSAELLVTRYVQDHGEWPTALAITAWGTSNMRTGGDDIAQAMALIGAKPVWDHASRRLTGYEIMPLSSLNRPRVDVTLRVSGFFRDAFPEQIALFDRAVMAIGQLEESADDNPVADRMRRETLRLIEAGAEPERAARRAGYRVFGSKPGAYGAGLQALIDEKGWHERADLAEAYLVWGGYAYGAARDGRDGMADGRAERALFEERLSHVDAVVQNQDNREHDLLDSDDYYQFEGGMTAAVEHLQGKRPAIYHNDHSRPERPVIRTLEEEIGRVVHARVVNPKWIAGVMRHGYKGAFEIAATVDYMFAFAATTGAVRDHHFEAAWRAFVVDDAVRSFIENSNPAAWREMNERFREAIERGLWRPRSNSARAE